MELGGRIGAVTGDSLAAIDDEGGRISYAALKERADLLAAEIGETRRLVLLEGGATIDWLIAYVACLRGRHPVLIVPAGATDATIGIEAAFAPAVRLMAANRWRPQAGAGDPALPLHPDLAVLLSTSGSTGSAKLVRLSMGNISANAAAIADYLAIGADECGLASLPTHYSYGLSIVNSHLHAGATLLLTTRSVIEPEFWAFAREHGATSFAGVPHSYDLLGRIDLAGRAPGTLRYFTQAGGRLAPEVVVRFADLAVAHGWRFHVMYGQTEATARMAHLPPERLADKAASIGVAIPGGRFELIDPQGEVIETAEGEGELVYYGPNVMMGYATSPADLSCAPGDMRLVTGDLARRDAEGFHFITGRLSRFIKIFGNRIGLDDVERLLRTEGHEAIATGQDDHLLVVTREAGAMAAIPALLADRLKLPAGYVTVRAVDEYPLLPSGKLDYAALKALLLPQPSPWRWWAPVKSAPALSVPAVFVSIFGDAAREESATFNSLGGDSLNYVMVATGLEPLVPTLPEDWETLSIGALTALSAVGGATSASAPRLPANLDTLRGFACLLVVAYHVIGYNMSTGLRLPAASGWHHVVNSFDYIRMPLFTALAGMLYAAMPASRGGFGPFIRRKARQIVIPLLFATFVIWGLRRVAYGGHDSLILAYLNGYQHLWYLYALTMMFVIAGLGDTKIGQSWRGWAVVMALLIAVRPFLPRIEFLAITNMLHLLPFFIMGMLLYRAPVLWRGKAMTVAAVIAAVALLALQQATMLGSIEAGGIWQWLEYTCAGAIVIAALRFAPAAEPLERLAAYSYTIYLWHPTANALARTVLLGVGLKAVGALFLLGMIAGTLGPVMLHRVMLRLPKLSLPVIGR